MNINLTLLGSWWLVIILALTGLLFAIALLKGAKTSKTDANTSVNKPSAELIKLDDLMAQHLPMLRTTLRHNRILVHTGAGKLMLTLDKKVAQGSRKLGEATVINFHQLPSVADLKQIIHTHQKDQSNH